MPMEYRSNEQSSTMRVGVQSESPKFHNNLVQERKTHTGSRANNPGAKYLSTPPIRPAPSLCPGNPLKRRRSQNQSQSDTARMRPRPRPHPYVLLVRFILLFHILAHIPCSSRARNSHRQSSSCSPRPTRSRPPATPRPPPSLRPLRAG
jgi:hypothetical protein